MLIERVFEIGGVVLGATGALMLAASFWDGFDPSAIGLIEAGVLFIGFGGMFWFIGRGARDERLRLLQLGETGLLPPPGPPPRR